MAVFSSFRTLACVIVGVITFNLVSYSIHGFWEFPGPSIVGVLVGGIIGSLWGFLLRFRSRLEGEIEIKDQLVADLTLNSERLRFATQHSPIWDWDIEADSLYISPSLAERLGYTETEFLEIVQGGFSKLVHPDDVAGYKDRLDKHLNDPIKPFISQHRLRTKSGEYRWYLGVGQSAVDNITGNSKRFSGSTTDVTERVVLEHQLQQSQKLESIGKLSGGVAHDFNNILAIILGSQELLIDSLTDPDQRELANTSIEAVRRGSDLTGKMLGFARLAPLFPEVAQVSSFIENLKISLFRTLPSSIELDFKAPPDLHPICVDLSSAENTLLNLVINSRDAMPDGGRITIDASNVRLNPKDVRSNHYDIAAGNYVVLKVSDTGSGIPPEILEKVCEPFFSTKPFGSGTGLGLSMVEGFAKQSGGMVQIKSKQGAGTDINLYFPAYVGEKTQIEKAQNSAQIDKSNYGKTILLVEDNLTVASLLKAMLEGAGFKVLSSASGDHAISVFALNPQIDLLLTDIVMPGSIQGTALAVELRAVRETLPVIFVSGYSEDESFWSEAPTENALRLMKPVQREELFVAINRVLMT